MIDLQVRIRRKIFSGAKSAALEDLHFEASQSDFVVIVGPSGAGKTTILNMVGGLDRQLEGEVLINGRVVQDRQRDTAAVGFMFQEPRLLPWLTVEENVRLVLGHAADAERRALDLLREVELGGHEHAYPHQLSGGMQRRAALARAFAVRPALLLMDEPFVSLDMPTANRLRAQLVALWQELGPTVLFVTHDLREALALADRIVFLSGSPGRVIKELPVDLPRPRQLFDQGVVEMHDRLLREHPQLLSGLSHDQGADATLSDPDRRRTG